MWTMIGGLPGQYRWAAELENLAVGSASTVLVCGMGGSGISGDFARVVAAEFDVDVRVHKGYGLPAWAGKASPLVVAVSYSGNTEEVLTSVTEARLLDLPIVAVSTGGELARIAAAQRFPAILVPVGLQPRAAVGFLVGATLRVIAGATSLPDPGPMLWEASAATAQLLETDEIHRQARDIAGALRGRIPVIWGSAGPAEVAAKRWAQQFNENSKVPAYWSSIPELDHNEIVAWGTGHGDPNAGGGIVMLRDSRERPEISRRFEMTVELVRDHASIAGEVWTSGESILARAATASLVGDLVSVYLAEALEVDPTPVDVITKLKNRL